MQDARKTDDREEATKAEKQIDFYDPWQQAFREEMNRRQNEFDF